jgi:23S rRNA (guanine745-N1)-methyltransferase
MKGKYDLANNFLNFNLQLMKCPICSEDLKLEKHYCKCINNHVFDISKKGYMCLFKNNNFKVSKIYDAKLFTSRRKFITNNFYKEMYENIVKIIKDKYLQQNITILDLGCGEGLHSNNIIKNLLNYRYIGMDYSKIAINMATDYLNENAFYFVGDVNNLPIKNNSIDIILDILSPYNEQEIRRVLKKDGIFIKVIPGKNYLIELRKALKIKEYEENNLLTKKFKNYEVIEISNRYCVDEEMKKNLIEMTPIKEEIKNYDEVLDKITINLKIFVIRGE